MKPGLVSLRALDGAPLLDLKPDGCAFTTLAPPQPGDGDTALTDPCLGPSQGRSLEAPRVLTQPAAPQRGTVMSEAEDAERAILALTRARGQDKSICPTEAAREMDAADWRARLPAVRDAARTLAARGLIDILRKGRPIAAGDVRGVIRLRAR